MTEGDKPAFLAAIGRLAIAQREKAPDSVMLRVYFEGLQSCEIEFVAAAAERLARASWFPKVGEWLHAAEMIERQRLEAQRAFLRSLPSPLCEACSDTGWVMQDARATRCGCVHERRLELLGRRPAPALPAVTDEQSPRSIAADEASRVLEHVEARTGRRLVRRGMPTRSPHGSETAYQARVRQLREQARQIGSALS